MKKTLITVISILAFQWFGALSAEALPPNPSLKEHERQKLSQVGYQLSKDLNPSSDAAKNAREIEDLEAQKKMAQWAEFTFYATLASAVVAALALIGIYFSVRQNTRAITISSDGLTLARTSNEVQLRAYVKISLNNSFKQLLTDLETSKIAIDFENVGSTPACNMKYMMDACFAANQEDSTLAKTNLSLDNESFNVLMPGDSYTKQKPYHPEMDDETKYWFKGLIDKKVKLIVEAIVIYDDVFGHSHKTTGRYEVFVFKTGEIYGVLSDSGNSAT